MQGTTQARHGLIRALSAAMAAMALAGAAPASAQSAQQCPWMDASKAPRERASQLLAAMTIDDKIALTYGSFSQYGFAAQTPANDALCTPAFVYSDGPSGVAGGFGGTQTGVTAFPVGIAQAASWDPVLQRRFGVAIGQEALAKGANVLLAPAMNINRVPMNGRNSEYFGEDPFLSSRAAVAETRGIQDNPVVATAKHYAINNQETDRMTVSAVVDERTQREIYLPAFEAAVREGHAGSVMCAYNRIDGVYACEHPGLLNDILKGDWGFDGWVMADWGATHSTEKAALAGLDQEQNGVGPTYFGDPLKAAVQAGKVPASRLDDIVMRILRPAFRFGLFDHRAAPQPGAFAANVSTAEHQKVANDMAEQGAVLLKDAGGVLPLDRIGQGTRIAIIGRSASPAGAQTAAVGSGSAHVNGTVVDPLQAITQRAAAQQAVVTYVEGDSVQDAVVAASAADIAIVFARDAAGEGADRPGLELNDAACVLIACQQLPTDQNELIASVAKANANTVVVLLTGAPISMPWLGDVKGLLEMWYPGSQFGTAAAALLFGDVNPSGKLPQSFPRAAADMPTKTPEQYPGKDGKVLYSEGLRVGYRWFDAQGIEPLFPFGFGLSYTSFAIDGLRVAPAHSGAKVVDVGFEVANTGKRTGAEVAQVYVGFPAATGEPPQQLKGFRKVSLAPGERQSVTIGLDERAFAHWDTGFHDWVVTPGCYTVTVGRSSRDIAGQEKVAVNGARCGAEVVAVTVPSSIALPPAPAKRACVDARRFAIKLTDPRGREALRTVVVRVDGKHLRTVKGKALHTALRRHRLSVDLRRQGGRVRVEVVGRTSTKRIIRRARSYRLCAANPRPAKNCIASRGFRSAAAKGSGKGLRFSFKRSGTAPVHVDLFQVSEGRRVLHERLIARFASRKAISWNGNKRRRFAPTDGYYFARFRVKAPSGFAEYKRIALRRKNARWSRQPQFYGTESCSLLRRSKLTRMVFGGTNRTKLGVSYLLARSAPVSITVTRGRQTVAKFTRKRAPGRKLQRVTLTRRSLERGRYRVRIVAGSGKSAKRATLYSRKI